MQAMYFSDCVRSNHHNKQFLVGRERIFVITNKLNIMYIHWTKIIKVKYTFLARNDI